MNKKKLALAVLALTLCIGITSAAVLTYYGQIITTVNVKQAIYLDGHLYDVPVEEIFNVTGGDVVFSFHNLTSEANVPVAMQFVTTITNETGQEDSVGIESTIIPYMEVTGYGSGDPFLPTHYKKYGYLYDAVTGTLGEINTITYAYMVLAESSGDNKPYVVLDLDTDADDEADKWVVEMMPPVATSKGTWHKVTLDNESLFHVPGAGTDWDQWHPRNFSDIKTAFGNARVLKTSIAFGAFPGDATYKAYGGIIQVDTFPTQIDTITLQPSECLDFYIRYDFAPNLKPDNYTITTTVEPIG